MQRIEHFALTILWSRLHRSTRHGYPGNFRTPHIVVATSDVQSHAATAPSGRFEPMAGND
jgi:hypothetical protein